MRCSGPPGGDGPEEVSHEVSNIGFVACRCGRAGRRSARHISCPRADAELENVPAGGSAAVASNWNPNQIPTNVNDLVWNLANTYSVSFGATTAASRTHTYRRGVVTVTAANPHTISTGLTVGDLSGDVATMTFTGGTLTSNGLTVIGDAAGSSGTLNVNDDDADFIVGGAASDMIVGSNAPGTLSITGGGLVSVADQFIAGSNTAGTSTVTVSGQLAVNPFTRSTLDVNGVSQSRLGQGGDATVNISNGNRWRASRATS